MSNPVVSGSPVVSAMPLVALCEIYDIQARLVNLPGDIKARAYLYAGALADIADIARPYARGHAALHDRADIVAQLVSALEALLEQADLGEVCEETQPVVDQARAAIAAARGRDE